MLSKFYLEFTQLNFNTLLLYVFEKKYVGSPTLNCHISYILFCHVQLTLLESRAETDVIVGADIATVYAATAEVRVPRNGKVPLRRRPVVVGQTKCTSLVIVRYVKCISECCPFLFRWYVPSA